MSSNLSILNIVSNRLFDINVNGKVSTWVINAFEDDEGNDMWNIYDFSQRGDLIPFFTSEDLKKLIDYCGEKTEVFAMSAEQLLEKMKNSGFYENSRKWV